MDKENPGWRDKISPDEWDDAFRDPIKEKWAKEAFDIEGIKNFDKWITEQQDTRKK